MLMGYYREGLQRLEWLGLVRLLQDDGRLSNPLVWFYNENGHDSGLHGRAVYCTFRNTSFVRADFHCLGQHAWEKKGTYVKLKGTDKWMVGEDSRGRAVRAAPIVFFQGHDESSSARLRTVAHMLWCAGQANQFNKMLPSAPPCHPLEFDDSWNLAEDAAVFCIPYAIDTIKT